MWEVEEEGGKKNHSHAGSERRFWLDNKGGEHCLTHLYPRLFFIFLQQNEIINNVGIWENGEWC